MSLAYLFVLLMVLVMVLLVMLVMMMMLLLVMDHGLDVDRVHHVLFHLNQRYFSKVMEKHPLNTRLFSI